MKRPVRQSLESSMGRLKNRGMILSDLQRELPLFPFGVKKRVWLKRHERTKEGGGVKLYMYSHD